MSLSTMKTSDLPGDGFKRPQQPPAHHKQPAAAASRKRITKSGGGRAPSTPRLMFVNYEDPTRDYQKPENRKVIAKYAMINRRKDKITPTRPPETLPPTSSRTAARPVDPAQRQRTPSAESVVSDFSASSGSQADSVGSDSPDNLVFLSHDNSPAPTAIEYFQFPPTGSHHLHGSEGSSPASSSFSWDASPNSSDYAGSSAAFTDLALTPSQVAFSPGDNRPNAFDGLFTFNSRLHLPDPFEGTAGRLDERQQNLIRAYLDGEFLSPAMKGSNVKIVRRMKKQRNSIWLRLALRSPSAMAALIAFTQATLDDYQGPDGAQTRRQYLERALQLIQADLNGPNYLDDSTVFAVVMLMIMAQHGTSDGTYQVHANGLKKLLGERAKLFENNSQLRHISFQTGLPTFDEEGQRTRTRCRYCSDNGSVRLSAQIVSQLGETRQSTCRGFYDLIDRGLLSEMQRPFIDQVRTWSDIADEAKTDRVAAAAAAQHAWTDGRGANYNSAFELAITCAVRLTCYLNAWLDWNHSCETVRFLVSSVYQAMLSDSDRIDELISVCRESLIWLCLAVGPFAEDEARVQFQELLKKVAKDYSKTDFSRVRMQVLNNFLWNASLTHAAENFWDASRIGEMSLAQMKYTNFQWQNNSGMF